MARPQSASEREPGVRSVVARRRGQNAGFLTCGRVSCLGVALGRREIASASVA